MEYTKKDLLRMKRELYEMALLEKRCNIFSSVTKLGTIGSLSGATVSLCMYLDELIGLEKSLTVGGACLAVSGMFALATHRISKEAKTVSNELFEYELECPDELVDEVYDSVYKRK